MAPSKAEDEKGKAAYRVNSLLSNDDANMQVTGQSDGVLVDCVL